ncbi:MAG: nickel pincer cofactor biosynthesis protein LarC [Candidatus Margulisiibacteriota bacterium]
MRTAYFDCFSGACGNMILGALVDAGLSIKKLRAELKKLRLAGYSLQSRKVKKNGISCTYLDVTDNSVRARGRVPQTRHLSDITRLITRSKLSRSVKERSVAVFTHLARAEAKVHGTSINKIHFHEVGAVDAIVDIVGSVIGLELLKIEKVYCSPFPLSRGFVDCAHGRLPVPAPATLELIKGVPVYGTDITGELVTPTGAAILTTLAEFKRVPKMRVLASGFGAGSRDHKHPNLLRVLVGEKATLGSGEVYVVETNIDDLNPQIYEYVIERLLSAGALDANLTPVIMKKSRPAVKLEVTAEEKDLASIKRIIFEETTSIGLRISKCERDVLPRHIDTVKTRFGPVRVKRANAGGRLLNAMPEYEDCKRAAAKHKAPLKTVYKEVERTLK